MSSPSKPRLIHESLHSISQSIRFLAIGAISQAIFMTGYNLSIFHFEPLGYHASTIYAAFYTFYIPVGHLLQCLFVFGWPKDYLPSLMSNAPIGLSAMVIGTGLTGFLSKVEFNAMAEDAISSILGSEPHGHTEEEGEFYSSLIVMVITGVWCFVLGLVVNKPEEGKKSKVEKDPAKEL